MAGRRRLCCSVFLIFFHSFSLCTETCLVRSSSPSLWWLLFMCSLTLPMSLPWALRSCWPPTLLLWWVFCLLIDCRSPWSRAEPKIALIDINTIHCVELRSVMWMNYDLLWVFMTYLSINRSHSFFQLILTPYCNLRKVMFCKFRLTKVPSGLLKQSTFQAFLLLLLLHYFFVLFLPSSSSRSPLFCSLADVWWEAVGSDVMDHAHLSGSVHLWGGQRLPLHLLSVSLAIHLSIHPTRLCFVITCEYSPSP